MERRRSLFSGKGSIAELLKKFSLRDTQSRRLVVEALHRVRKPSSPYDVQKNIATRGATINTVTVYRILATFEKLGIVHKHPCNGQYALCSIPEQKGHHGFLHCDSCGEVEEFCEPKLCKMENAIAKSAKFRPSSHVSEIVGTCHSCS